MRNLSFIENEFYHIYNRGVDRRAIFQDKNDVDRFFRGIKEFNVLKPIGSLYENRKRKHGSRGSRASTDLRSTQPALVEIIAYCTNPNHYHFILKQISEKGIEKSMHRLGTGYSKYFNIKNKRSGALFQSKFKAKHINTNEYLLHLSAYINLNHQVHSPGSSASTLSRTSWDEYTKDKFIDGLCKKEIILGQFKNKEAYQKFAEGSLKSIVERKILLEELEDGGIELINTA